MKITGIGQEKIHDYDDERSATIWNRSVTIKTQNRPLKVVGGRFVTTHTGARFSIKALVNSPFRESTEVTINGPQGHLANVGTTSYVYVCDPEKRPTTTTMNTATSVYVYDAPHRHLVMTVNGAVVQTLAVVVHVSRFADAKCFQGKRRCSVAEVAESVGGEVECYMYDAYGRQTVLANNGVVAYKPSDYGQFVGFTGRYHDWETGLQYFRARYFDNLLGRFIGRDPLGYVDGRGLYGAYLVPNGIDPFGLKVTVIMVENKPPDTDPKSTDPISGGIIGYTAAQKAKLNNDFIKQFEDKIDKMSERKFNEMRDAGLVKFNDEVFKGKKDDFKKAIERETTTVNYEPNATLEQLEKMQKEAGADQRPQDDNTVFFHSDNNGGLPDPLIDGNPSFDNVKSKLHVPGENRTIVTCGDNKERDKRGIDIDNPGLRERKDRHNVLEFTSPKVHVRGPPNFTRYDLKTGGPVK